MQIVFKFYSFDKGGEDGRKKSGKEEERNETVFHQIQKRNAHFYRIRKVFIQIIYLVRIIDLDGNFVRFTFLRHCFRVCVCFRYGIVLHVWKNGIYYIYILKTWNSSTIVAVTFVYLPKPFTVLRLRQAKNHLKWMERWTCRELGGGNGRVGEKKPEMEDGVSGWVCMRWKDRSREKKKSLSSSSHSIQVRNYIDGWNLTVFVSRASSRFACYHWCCCCLCSRWTISFFKTRENLSPFRVCARMSGCVCVCIWDTKCGRYIQYRMCT